MRTITPLTDGWQYAVCEPLNDAAALPVCHDWQPVALPHVWNRDTPGEAGPRAYRCTLRLAPRSGRALFFRFEAVGGLARVWLNGQCLGQHKGGYSRFCLDASGAAR